MTVEKLKPAPKPHSQRNTGWRTENEVRKKRHFSINPKNNGANTALNTQLSAPSSDHAHHWKIAEAEGPVSEGICKHCGTRKPFKNWPEDLDFSSTTWNDRRL